MKLSKALELNKESDKSLRDHKFIDHADAVKLGNEAINYIMHLRACSIKFREAKLPSETQIPDLAPSAERKQKLRESPLGKAPRH